MSGLKANSTAGVNGWIQAIRCFSLVGLQFLSAISSDRIRRRELTPLNPVSPDCVVVPVDVPYPAPAEVGFVVEEPKSVAREVFPAVLPLPYPAPAEVGFVVEDPKSVPLEVFPTVLSSPYLPYTASGLAAASSGKAPEVLLPYPVEVLSPTPLVFPTVLDPSRSESTLGSALFARLELCGPAVAVPEEIPVFWGFPKPLEVVFWPVRPELLSEPRLSRCPAAAR